MSAFDDLASVMTDPDIGFGEAITYESQDLGTLAIYGVWSERPILQGLEPAADALQLMLAVLKSDFTDTDGLHMPAEGDTVTRTKTGEEFTVVPPIQPDDIGMITVALQKTE